MKWRTGVQFTWMMGAGLPTSVYIEFVYVLILCVCMCLIIYSFVIYFNIIIIIYENGSCGFYFIKIDTSSEILTLSGSYF